MANGIERRAQDFCCKLYRAALFAMPAHARASYAQEVEVIAADFVADSFETDGWPGLLRACMVLTRDALVNAVIEWRNVSGLIPAVCAGLVITLSNFWFGNDFAGTVYWALTIAASAVGLGLWLRSASIALVTALVFVDTSAGILSVVTSHQSLEPVFADTLEWVPLAIFLIAVGAYSGARISRVLIKPL